MSRRSRVLAALTILTAVGFILDRLALSPWLEKWGRLAAEIERVDGDLGKARAILGREAKVREEWNRVKALLSKPRVPDVQTHFVSNLGEICDDVGVNFEVQASPDVQQGDFREYVFETKLKLTWPQLVALLVEIHNSREFLKPLRIGLYSQYEREDRVDLDLKVSTIDYVPPKARP